MLEFYTPTSKINNLVDLSADGIVVNHNNGSIKVGDIIPVTLKYKDVSVDVDTQVVLTSANSIKARFVNIDLATANKILYLCMCANQ